MNPYRRVENTLSVLILLRNVIKHSFNVSDPIIKLFSALYFTYVVEVRQGSDSVHHKLHLLSAKYIACWTSSSSLLDFQSVLYGRTSIWLINCSILSCMLWCFLPVLKLWSMTLLRPSTFSNNTSYMLYLPEMMKISNVFMFVGLACLMMLFVASPNQHSMHPNPWRCPSFWENAVDSGGPHREYLSAPHPRNSYQIRPICRMARTCSATSQHWCSCYQQVLCCG